MRLLVTHLSPDLDAISSCWLIRRFLPRWKDVPVVFVPAGSTWEKKPPDSDPHIIHVDTGMGMFDHHQTNEHTCAARLVFDYLLKNGHIPRGTIQPLERIVSFITLIDHFGEVHFPDPADDQYDFSLYRIIEGLKNELKDDGRVTEYVFTLLDGILHHFTNKVAAENEIKKGYVFRSRWGKTLALESGNDETVKLALKMGYDLVIKKNPTKGNVRINSFPRPKSNLTPLYKKVIALDPQASWFFHASGNILINGSTKNPFSVPSRLTLHQLIEIIKKI